MDWFSSQNNNLLLPAKLTFWAGIIKQLFGQLLARYLIYLTRKNRYWAQLTLRPISALPCQINQTSDSSRPNNCLIFGIQCDQISRHVISVTQLFANRTTCLLIERHWNVCELKLLFFNCARWTGLQFLKSLFLIVVKET